jgi:LmbE family N-acetylglucosaminyl deacetylase
MIPLLAGVRSIVAVGAHPDDIEIGAGGLLLTLPPGVNVHYLLLTGSRERHAEARAAAQAFLPGANLRLELHDLPDARLPAHWERVKNILQAAVTEGTPDLVLAPAPFDAHQDHSLLGRLVTTAFRDVFALHYELPKWDSEPSMPNVYLPLDVAVLRRKVELLNRHYPSQADRAWWDDEFFTSIARLRGVQCHARYAEAYFSAKATIKLGSA